MPAVSLCIPLYACVIAGLFKTNLSQTAGLGRQGMRILAVALVLHSLAFPSSNAKPPLPMWHGSPSCSVEMNHGQGKTLSALLFMMLNAMLNAYLANQARGGSHVLRI